MMFNTLISGDVCELHPDHRQWRNGSMPRGTYKLINLVQVVATYNSGNRAVFLLPLDFNGGARGWTEVRPYLLPEPLIMKQFDKWDIGQHDRFITRVIENRPLGDFDVNGMI